jgi:hypothetical protein
VVLTAGETIIDGKGLAEGSQVYVVAPPAVRVAAPPPHKTDELPLTLRVGDTATLTVTARIAVHPKPLEPITEYIEAVCGLTIIFAKRLPEGSQV